VPCFIHWPAQGWEGGRDIAQLTAHVDLIPTFIDALSLAVPGASSSDGIRYSFDGLSLLPLIEASAADEPWDSRVIITDTQRDDFPEKWKKSATMQGPWRLIDGKELYHVGEDPGQRRDVADQNPVKVAELRKAYETWWTELEPDFEVIPRPVIGEKNNPDAVLYSHDWHEVKDQAGEKGQTPWNQKQVREGLATNGFWTVEIAEEGEYEVSLCRWPLESGLALRDGVEMKPAVDGGRPLPKGKALSIEKAKLRIGDQTWETGVEASLDRVSFSVKLDVGPFNIQTWFTDDAGREWGAYYVYIKKKS
ncbi:MAG: N-acetylgalactosamine-4-sulfatase, partial [Bacteroidota bacterium]